MIFDSRALPCGTDGGNGVMRGRWDYTKSVRVVVSMEISEAG